MNSNNKGVLIALAGIAAIWFILALAVHSQNKLSSRLPPKAVFQDEAAAKAGALAWIQAHAPQAHIVSTSGTPSMEPFIHGRTWVVVDPNVPYEEIRTDDCIEYVSHDASQGIRDGTYVLHVVAAIDSGGFIMAGINNVASESASRVRRPDYIGKLLFVADWPQ